LLGFIKSFRLASESINLVSKKPLLFISSRISSYFFLSENLNDIAISNDPWAIPKTLILSAFVLLWFPSAMFDATDIAARFIWDDNP